MDCRNLIPEYTIDTQSAPGRIRTFGPVLTGQPLSRRPHSTTLAQAQKLDTLIFLEPTQCLLQIQTSYLERKIADVSRLEPSIGIEPMFMLYESIVLPLNEEGILFSKT